MKINWKKLVRDVIIAILSALAGGAGTYACMWFFKGGDRQRPLLFLINVCYESQEYESQLQ